MDPGAYKNSQLLQGHAGRVRTHFQASAAPWWQCLGPSLPRTRLATCKEAQRGQGPVPFPGGLQTLGGSTCFPSPTISWLPCLEEQMSLLGEGADRWRTSLCSLPAV